MPSWTDRKPKGCADRKPAFSREQFNLAKSECNATDAYIIEAVPNTIGFHGSSHDHTRQAQCLREKLAKFDVETAVLGSQLY